MSAQVETVMPTPWGEIFVHRLPAKHDLSLRAWDAADSYVLDHLAANRPPDRAESWLIVNDLFGALTVGLADNRPQSWSDSVTSHQAIRDNLERNDIDPDQVRLVRSTEDPTGPIDVAIIKIPRSLALLESQLRRLKPMLQADSVVIGAGMTKSIHRSTIELFTKIIGPSPTSLAVKKARLIHSTVDLAIEADASDGPTTYSLELDQLTGAKPVVDFPNVFSRGRLDRGTKTMLDHLPTIANGADVVDLGCGNGLLGLVAAERFDLGSVTFIDESYHAVASAQATAEAWGISTPTKFVAAWTVDGADRSADVVLNNPPFHSHQSRTDVVARSMFRASARTLRPNGWLAVVGNRHLRYDIELKRHFQTVDVVGSNAKFVVYRAG